MKNKNPKILFLNHRAKMGGSEFGLFDIAKNFPKCEVILCEHGELEERLIRSNISVKIWPLSSNIQKIARKSKNYWAKLKTIPEVLKMALKIAKLASKFDCIYANSQKTFIIGSIATIFCKKPLIWHLRDILSEEHFSSSHIKLDVKYANKFATIIIANSEATRQSFIINGGNPEKIVTIYNGIETQQFKKIDQNLIEQYKKSLNINLAKPTIGLFGRLTEWKGQHIAINAFKKVPEAQLIIVGSPLFDDDSYFEKLIKLTKRLKLVNRVFFIGQRADTSPILQICDIIIHTSVAPEPFGRVIVEGMLSEKPVIATRGGGALEIIDHNVNGLLVPMNQPELLAKAINYLLKNPEEAKKLAKNGYKKASKYFDQDQMIKKIKEIIIHVTNKTINN